MSKSKVFLVTPLCRSYDPDAEWARLRDSGILKSVNKDGTFVDLYD